MNLSPQSIDAFLHRISPAASVLAAGLGMFMPLVVAFVNQPGFSKRKKAILSVLSCVAASAIVCLAEGAFTGVNWFASLFIMLTTTWLFFASFYKPTGAADWFEKATTVAGFAPLVAGLLGSRVSLIISRAGRYADGSSVLPLAPPAASADPEVNLADINAPANAAVASAILMGGDPSAAIGGAVSTAVSTAVSAKVSDAVEGAVSGAAAKIFK